MSFITSVIIVILAMVIQGFLQLTPSVFAIFYHNTTGKRSAHKASDLSLQFFLGTEIFCAFMFLATYLLLSVVFIYSPEFITNVMPWALAGIFFALSIISFFWYFRPGRGTAKTTELFISRRAARHLLARTEKAKTRTDAFMLGALTGTLEVGFTLPLYLTCVIPIISFTNFPGFLTIVLYITAALLPLFIIHALYASHHNLAEIQRLRVRHKPFYRTIISLGFLVLACLNILIGVL